MSELESRTTTAASTLAELSEEQLFEQLGRRVKGIGLAPDKAGDPAAVFGYAAEEMGGLDELRDFGERLFNNVLAQARDFVCGDDPSAAKERQELLNAIGGDATKVAGAVAAGLVTTIGLAPAAAAVVGALVVKRLVPATYEALCDWWQSAP